MSTRVYVPSTWSRLGDLLLSGGIGPAPFPAHAVTSALRSALADDGEEEQEYAALSAAAQDSVGLLRDVDRPLRVVVVAEATTVLEVEDAPPGAEPSLVEVADAVPLLAVVAVHVDSEDAAEDVRAAREVWAAARKGDGPALDVLDRCRDHELGWYATQEVATLVNGA